MSEYKLKIPKKVEETLVGTYKKIENGVVGAYKKIETKFVDTFLEKVDGTAETLLSPDHLTETSAK